MLHKNVIMERALRAVIVAAFFALPAVSQSQPIQIGSYDDLRKIGFDDACPLNGAYELANDIDVSECRERAGGFYPIGSSLRRAAFTGTFDGKGHTISGLYINRKNDSGMGLFGIVENAVISRVVIAADSVIGDYYVGALVGIAINSTISGCVLSSGVVIGKHTTGGLVGETEGGDITDCYTEKPVVVTGPRITGGLIGLNTGTVTNSRFSGTMVEGDSIAGGLIGINKGTVTGCSYEFPNPYNNGVRYKGGRVVGVGRIGGLVGINDSGAVIEKCYAKTSVLEGSGMGSSVRKGFIGGLVGFNRSGTVKDSYHEAFIETIKGVVTKILPQDTVSGKQNVGGLIGCNSGIVTRCYSASFVTGGETSVGGLIGFNASTGTVTESYSDPSGIVEGSYFGIGGLVGDNSGTINKCYSLSEVKALANPKDESRILGGLVGGNYEEGRISECYSAGIVTGGIKGWDDIGGLVGDASDSKKITNSFWDTEISGQTVSYGGEGLETILMVGLGLRQGYGWDFDKVWQETSSYPQFKYQPAPASVFRTGPSRRVGASLVPMVSVRGKSLSVSAAPDSRVRVRLVNMSGRTVANFVSFGSASHSLRGLPAGAYIAEVRRGAYRSAASVVVK